MPISANNDGELAVPIRRLNSKGSTRKPARQSVSTCIKLKVEPLQLFQVVDRPVARSSKMAALTANNSHANDDDDNEDVATTTSLQSQSAEARGYLIALVKIEDKIKIYGKSVA